MTFIAPQSGLRSFTCPYCNAIARQYHWGYMNALNAKPVAEAQTGAFQKTFARLSKCEHCEKVAIWHRETLIYPDRGGAPPPNPDMPEEIKDDYEEASQILRKSPRGAAALLRLAIQKLCVKLGGKGKNINDDIKLLVQKGLPAQVQESLDVVRVTGNSAVHPGQLDVNDVSIAANLFPLVNVIVEYMISLPERVQGLYQELPEGSKEQIKKRDGKK